MVDAVRTTPSHVHVASAHCLDLSDANARTWIEDRVRSIRGEAGEVRIGAWNPSGGGGADYLFFRQGADVVVMTGAGAFVSVLKGGSSNAWFSGAHRIG